MFASPPSSSHYESALKLLKPGGKIFFQSVTDASTISSELKLQGFVNPTVSEKGLTAEKPNYEVGSSVKLSFAKKTSDVAAVWKIDNDEDVETIDPDDLLDEEDKVLPDPETLRVCGTTGKKKACKNCSCGLAEELEAEKSKTDVNTANAKSSCGSVSFPNVGDHLFIVISSSVT